PAVITAAPKGNSHTIEPEKDNMAASQASCRIHRCKRQRQRNAVGVSPLKMTPVTLKIETH
ncbi:MAG: hypothetical protein ACK49N_03490, partial [Verrucomicrobiota bacterium]